MHNRNYNRNKKLFKIITLGAMAIMMIGSYRVSAAESHTFPKQQRRVVFQRQCWTNKQLLENLKIKINQAADCALLPSKLA